MNDDTNTRVGAYEIPSRALAEWLWRTQTWPKIRREAEQAKVREALS